MAMGKRKSEQAPMWVSATDLPISPGHPFYARLNTILDNDGFDRFVEEQCRQFYAPVMGRPSLPPGRYFRESVDADHDESERDAVGSGLRRRRHRRRHPRSTPASQPHLHGPGRELSAPAEA